MANRRSVTPADVKGDDREDPVLTKRFYGFNPCLVLGPGHTKDFKNGSGPCTQHEVGITKHNWSAWCQYNVTWWGSIWAYDMFSQ